MNTIRKKQSTSSTDMSNSVYYHYLITLGWVLRTLNDTNPTSEKAKQFIEDMSGESQKTRSKLTIELVQQ